MFIRGISRVASCFIAYFIVQSMSVAPLLMAADVNIVINDLTDNAIISGIEYTSPPSLFINTDNYSISASGDVTGLYENTSFSAFGIYTESETEINNSGNLELRATGGTASKEASVTAEGITNTGGKVINNGAINVSGTGGTISPLSDQTSMTTHANANSTGILSNSDVFNNGSIEVTATGGTASWFFGSERSKTTEAAGIVSYGTVENSASIDVHATGGQIAYFIQDDTPTYFTSAANSFGIYAFTDINNSGDINVSTAASYQSDSLERFGILRNFGLYNDLSQTGIIINSGDIRLTSSFENRNYLEYEAEHWGIASTGGIKNSGSVIIDGSNGITTSVYALVTGGTTINSGNINITTTSKSGYVPTAIDSTGEVENYGDINLSVTTLEGNKVNTHANGIRSSQVNNSGDINVLAYGGKANSSSNTWAFAIYSHSDMKNTGKINVTAIGNISGISTYVDTFGIAGGGIIVNQGDISVRASGGSKNELSWAEAYGIRGWSDINNGANIDVSSENSAYSFAYGIETNDDCYLKNTGSIRANANTAYELIVKSGTTTLLDEYKLTLDGNPSTGSLYISDGASIDLNNAKLSLAYTAETLAMSEYRIFSTDETGRVIGSFSNLLTPENPSITANYDNQNTIDSSDDTVVLSYQPTASAALGAARTLQQSTINSATIVNNHISNLLIQATLETPSKTVLLASADTVVSDAGHRYIPAPATSSIFIQPYYSRIDNEEKPLGYDGNIRGFVAGYEKIFDKNLYGFNFGYTEAGIDFKGDGFKGNSENQDIFTLGVNAAGQKNNFSLRLSSTAFYGDHNYNGLSGAVLTSNETASYHSFGTYSSMMLGRMYHFDSHILYPEIGFNHIWTYRKSYTSDVSGASTWNTHFSSVNDHELQAEAKLRWLGSIESGQFTFIPSLAVGMKQFLTDAETSVTQSLGGSAPVRVTAGQDQTAFTFASSLVTKQKDNLNLTLAYEGECSRDANISTFWLKLEKVF